MTAPMHAIPGVGYPRGMLPPGYEHTMRGIPQMASHPQPGQMQPQVPGKP